MTATCTRRDVTSVWPWFLPALGALAVGSCGPAAPPFVLEEATISGIHAAFASGTLTCRQLVTEYLARIEAYDDDDDGPALNAVLTVNPRATGGCVVASARDRRS